MYSRTKFCSFNYKFKYPPDFYAAIRTFGFYGDEMISFSNICQCPWAGTYEIAMY